MFSFLWKTGRPATLGLIPSKQKCWHKASRTTLESTVPGRLRSLSLCVSSHFICLAYITAQSWVLWPLFNMTPVGILGKERGNRPLDPQKENNSEPTWVFLSSRDEVGLGAGSAPRLCVFSGMWVLPAGEPTGAPNVSSHGIQALCLPGPSPAQPGPPSQRCFWLIAWGWDYTVILPRQSAGLTVPSLMPVFLILSSGIMEWKRDNQEENKKGRKGGEDREKIFGQGVLYASSYLISSPCSWRF